MSKNVIGARVIHRLSYVEYGTPTVPNSDDHTMGWVATDIYKGELYINMNDDRAFTRTNTNNPGTINPNGLQDGIIEFLILDKSTSKVPVTKMANSVNGNFYISSGLTVGSLTGSIGSGLRPVFADEYGSLSIFSAIPGTGTVTQITLGNGLTGSTTEISTTGNIELGTPSSIHSGSTNLSSSGTHTHRFIPAGNTTEIQLNSGGILSSSPKFKYDGNDLYVSGMTQSSTTYSVFYDSISGKLTYNIFGANGNTTEIQFNSSGTLSSSSNFKYDGTDLYVSGMTQSATTYGVFYDSITGKFTYNSISGNGTVTNIQAGDGMSFSDITSSGYITLGTPNDITFETGNWLYTNGHTHRLLVEGIAGSIQYKTNTSSGITGNDKFIYDGNDLYVSGMTNTTTDNVVYFDETNGKLTYGVKNIGTMTSVMAGSGMSFSDITTSGYIEMGTPSTITPSTENELSNISHTHKFIAAGGSNEIQLNIGGALSSSMNLTYDGIDLYISGMTNTTTDNVVYFDETNGKLTYGIKPSGGSGELITTGSTLFDSGTTIIIDTYPTSTHKFATYHYCIYSGETNTRAGILTIVNNSTETRITESSTQDIGNTMSVTFSTIINGSNVELYVDSTTDGWVCDWVKIIN